MIKTISAALGSLAILLTSNLSGKTMTQSDRNGMELAVIGGGCFWCTEAEYQNVNGVSSIVSGYAGGTVANPTYEQVCTGQTGHAEVVQVEFDPKVISYKQIIDLFWLAHDPTTLNRQGADTGTQYRSIILYRNEVQKAAAELSRQEAKKKFKDPIVTQIVPLTVFYPAEDYHQNYYRTNPNQGYSAAVIAPKVQHFKEELKNKAPEAVK